jgi:hypothetical protein
VALIRQRPSGHLYSPGTSSGLPVFGSFQLQTWGRWGLPIAIVTAPGYAFVDALYSFKHLAGNQRSSYGFRCPEVCTKVKNVDRNCL